MELGPSQDYSVNYINLEGKEVTASFFSLNGAKDFVEHIGDRFVECNFALDAK